MYHAAHGVDLRPDTRPDPIREDRAVKLSNHDDVMAAIHDRREVLVTWVSKEDGGTNQTRRCAPMDYGPSRIAADKTPRYFFWDFESDSGQNHTLGLLAGRIVSVEILDSTFNPADFVTWDTTVKSPWWVPRTTWGADN